MLGVEEVDEVQDESTCRQINLLKSDSDEICITSESDFFRAKICSVLTQTVSSLRAFARALTNINNLWTSLARNSLRKTLFSARSGRLGKMLTTKMFPLRILSLITSIRTCTDLNRSMSENDVRTAVSPFGVLELSFSLALFSFLILITSTKNLVAPMKLEIRVTISSYDNCPRVGKPDTTISAVDS